VTISPKCPTVTPARAPSDAGACVTYPHLGGGVPHQPRSQAPQGRCAWDT